MGLNLEPNKDPASEIGVGSLFNKWDVPDADADVYVYVYVYVYLLDVFKISIVENTMLIMQ